VPRSNTPRQQRARAELIGKHALVAICAGAGVFAAALYALQQRDPSPAPAVAALQSVPGAPVAAASQAAAESVAKPAARRIYPYSVVPGGVSGKDELVQVIKRDQVVARHYANFAVEQAREIKVDKPRAVYVSYRKGDQVYWTAKKLMLAEGETLLTDGSNEMRARCANRISDTPQLPVEAKGPTEEELDSSVMEQVSAEVQGEEGLGFAFSLQTFATTGGASPGATTPASMDIDMTSPGGTGGSLVGTLSTTDTSSSTSTRDRPTPDTASGSSSGDTSGETSSSGTPPTGGKAPDGSDATSPVPPGEGETTNPDGGTPPTGGSDQPNGETPSSKPPVETSDPPPKTSPDITPLIPEPDALPPIPGNPGENQTGLADLPEPGSLWLSVLGLAALMRLRRKPR
jgi:hypothetical protein